MKSAADGGHCRTVRAHDETTFVYSGLLADTGRIQYAAFGVATALPINLFTKIVSKCVDNSRTSRFFEARLGFQRNACRLGNMRIARAD